MGWYGSFSIEYKGKQNDKFVKLAKLIIPNYIERFEVEDESILNCKRGLSWYSAEVDVCEIMRYLNEKGEEIIMSIDGETHPMVPKQLAEEKGLYYEYPEDYYDYDEDLEDDEIQVDLLEEIIKFKNLGNDDGIVIENEYPDYERYTSDMLGKLDEFYDYDRGEIDDLNRYIELVASIVENDIKMQEKVCLFLTSIKQALGEIKQDRVREFLESAENKEKLLKFLKGTELDKNNSDLSDEGIEM